MEQFGEPEMQFQEQEEDWAGQGWQGDQEQSQEGTDWAGKDQEQEQVTGHNGEVSGWGQQASVSSWGQQASVEQPAATSTAEIDPNADIWKAVVLFSFEANNSDEITITENEQVDILVKECDEEGWVKVRNAGGQTGYAPTNYVEVYASETLPAAPGEGGWVGQPTMQTIPETGEYVPEVPAVWSHAAMEENSSEEEGEETEAETEDDMPPGESQRK